MIRDEFIHAELSLSKTILSLSFQLNLQVVFLSPNLRRRHTLPTPANRNCLHPSPMPELPEVHRATHFLRRFLVQPGIHTLTSVSYYSPPDKKDAATATTDAKIFDTAKTGTDAPTFCAQLEGKKVKDIGRLGKYFWLEMESAPHPLFHFGVRSLISSTIGYPNRMY